MKDLYNAIKAISELKKIGVMFSCGRDSIIMLDLFMKFARKSVQEIIFMYFCPGLSFDEMVLLYYEKRYNIKIKRHTHYDNYAMLAKTGQKSRKLDLQDAIKYYKKIYNLHYLAFGFRKDESLQRRGMMAHLENGIDGKYGRVYPLIDWNKKHIEAYIKKERLVLPVEYHYNFRDLNSLKGDTLLYVYNNYPKDYQKIIAAFPDLQGELLRILP